MWFTIKVVLAAVIVVLTVVLLYKYFSVKGKRKIEELIAGIVLPLIFFIYPVLPADTAPAHQEPSGAPATSMPAPLTSYRFDMYNDDEIIKRIDNINKDLSQDGKHINEDLLKAFIYALNGDYSLGLSQDEFFAVSDVFGNVDNDFVNIVRNYKSPVEFQFVDECTTIDSFADVFRDPDEYEYVLYWQTSYNTLKSNIYELGMSEERLAEIDAYCIEFYNAFVRNKPINLSPDKQRDVYSITANALFAISCCISNATELLPTSPYGGSRDDMIVLDPINNTIISATALASSIRQVAEKYLNIMVERVVKAD